MRVALCILLVSTTAVKTVFPMEIQVAQGSILGGIGLPPRSLHVAVAVLEGAVAGGLLTRFWRQAAWGALGLNLAFALSFLEAAVKDRVLANCGCLGALSIDPASRVGLILAASALSVGLVQTRTKPVRSVAD